MSFDEHLGRARALGPAAVVKAALRHGARLVSGAIAQLIWFFKRSYGPPTDPRGFAERVPAIPADLLASHAETILQITDLYLQHRFDLLGSGWVQVAHGMKTAGFNGTAYPPEYVPGDISLRLNPGNRAHAVRLRKQIDRHYVPIDWHIDFKSGYRWREDRVADAIVYGHGYGIDVKVPWELARMQHLVHLAWAYILAENGTNGFRESAIYFREYRNQVLDFMAANPPGFGVNWASAMDIAIRAANIALSCDLFRRHGAAYDPAFAGTVADGLRDHGEQIVQRLGRGPKVKGNHYLGEICGLAFVAAYLPRTAETGAWLDLAARELVAETARQFHPDGGHFEGSTGYHRLCGEMTIYATAILAPHIEFPRSHLTKIRRIAAFAEATVKPDGHAIQIGDNDSGRFFKNWPAFDPVGDLPVERTLDHRGLIAAAAGLFGETGDGNAALESALVRGLGGGLEAPDVGAALERIEPTADPPTEWNREIAIVPPDARVLDGLRAAAYPDFGLFVWRGPRLFLSVRCGATGGPGPGAHAHNDQLAVELQIDGTDWLADPGTHVYTPDPEARNAYRSVMAHAAPRWGEREPARLDRGMFRLENSARAECLVFDTRRFVGRHFGYGTPIARTIEIGGGRIVIRDAMGARGPSEKVEIRDPEALRAAMGVSIPFSPGYGRKNR
jgi:hypothetical protein